MVRPGWGLPLLRTAAGGVIGAEGARWCALGGGWAALGNCRRGKRMPSPGMQAFLQRATSMEHRSARTTSARTTSTRLSLGTHRLGAALLQFPMSRICS